MSVNHDTFKALQELSRMTVGQLRERYLDLFGEETKSHNKAYLQKRIAWRIQFLVEGGLTERAKARAAELARNSELRVRQKRDPYKWGSAELRSRSVLHGMAHSFIELDKAVIHVINLAHFL